MTIHEYLTAVLKAQTLTDDSGELSAIQQHRENVDKLLREQFADSSPTIRYGGSKAKGTMIKESYDLDIICYFPRDNEDAGGTLEDIYNNARAALQKKYVVEPKTSALRLMDADPTRRGLDFHIDVVPGRFTDDSKTDAYLYQSNADKKRLKTNINVHISHVRDSGVTDAIRLVKLWKVRNGIAIKTFILELAVIKLLTNQKKSSLDAQLTHVWTKLRDQIDDLVVEDPANPQGNDLSGALAGAKDSLRTVARRTLSLIESSGWETVFGSVDKKSDNDMQASLRRVASTVSTPTRPWCTDVT